MARGFFMWLVATTIDPIVGFACGSLLAPSVLQYCSELFGQVSHLHATRVAGCSFSANGCARGHIALRAHQLLTTTGVARSGIIPPDPSHQTGEVAGKVAPRAGRGVAGKARRPQAEALVERGGVQRAHAMWKVISRRREEWKGERVDDVCSAARPDTRSASAGAEPKLPLASAGIEPMADRSQEPHASPCLAAALLARFASAHTFPPTRPHSACASHMHTHTPLHTSPLSVCLPYAHTLPSTRPHSACASHTLNAELVARSSLVHSTAQC